MTSLQWSFGVTCWEVFALGSMPYAGVDPFVVMRYLQEEQRVEKPMNAACSAQVSVKLLELVIAFHMIVSY